MEGVVITQTVEEEVSLTQTFEKGFSKTQIVDEGLSRTQTVEEGISITQTTVLSGPATLNNPETEPNINCITGIVTEDLNDSVALENYNYFKILLGIT